MAIVAGSASVVALSAIPGLKWSATAMVVVSAIGVVFTAGLSAFWLTRWPTRRQSELVVTIGSVLIPVWGFTQPATAIAALACSALAVTGGYIAFFHTNKLLVFNLCVVAVSATAAAWRLGSETDAATAIAAFWLIWFVNLTVPLAIRGMSRAMGTFAVRSHLDPLTGLLNRRGFADTVTRQLAAAPGTETHLGFLMVDLDDFKLVNDTRGHAAGDRALLAVAELLRERSPHGAAICRAGGEEFLVAIRAGRDDVGSIAAHLCRAIADLPHLVTASIGTSHIGLDTFRDRADESMLDELVAAADAAMYVAKRNGGNRVEDG